MQKRCIFNTSQNSARHYVIDGNSLSLHYSSNHITIKKKLRIIAKGTTSLWTVIPHFKLVIAGDLSFFATSTGRDGRSHCRCVYCSLVPSEWSSSEFNPISDSSMLSLSHLEHYATIHEQSIHHSNKTKPDTKGVIMQPLLNFEPEDYIVPLLHLEIGIVNKAWDSLLYFLDEFVENVSDVEADIKDEIVQLEKDMDFINEEIVIQTVNRDMSLSERNNESEAHEMYEATKKRLKELNLFWKLLTLKNNTSMADL